MDEFDVVDVRISNVLLLQPEGPPLKEVEEEKISKLRNDQLMDARDEGEEYH
jgi:hypothetical protein